MKTNSRSSLTGQVAIVTGSGGGIGKEIALTLAEAGADMVVAGINVQDKSKSEVDLSVVADEIRGFGRRALIVVADMRETKEVTVMIENTIREFGRIDIAVNNAGGMFACPALELSDKGWDAIIRENLTTTFTCCREEAKVMVAHKHGKIINMSSGTALQGYPKGCHYAAAKAGIINLTKTLAIEWGPYNVRVNAIAPGHVETPSITQRWGDAAKREEILKKIPLGRLAQVEDVAGAALFLASEASSYVTGHTLVVDGAITDHCFM